MKALRHKFPHRALVMAMLALTFPLFASDGSSWASRILHSMSSDEKIGQLFMVAGYLDSDFAEKEIGNPRIIEEIESYIADYHIGGIAYVGPSESATQVALTNHYQKISKTPLLIAQDLEWGLSMRLKDGMNFPKNITLGAVADNRLIYKMGREIGAQAKLIGVQMNLSPVLDVNIEPENIAINARSFGSTPSIVAEKGVAMIRGLQDEGIIASAKHFPGLGDIGVDPHFGLPWSNHSKERLENVEFYPFAKAIEAGVLSIQTEHLLVPALEPEVLPASLSPKVISNLLKREMGFTGLVLSGALRMKALTDAFADEEVVLKAFLAGHDMLLMPVDLPKAYQTMRHALAEGKIAQKTLDERVLKILELKEKVGLHRCSTVEAPSWEQLHSPAAQALKRDLYKSAVALVRDSCELLSSGISARGPIAYVQLGDAATNECYEKLKQSVDLDAFIFPLGEDHSVESKRLLENIARYPLVVLAVYPADPRRIVEIRLMNGNEQKEELAHFRVHGITEQMLQIRDALEPYHQKTVVAYFGNPFGTHFFDRYAAFLMAYEPDPDAQLSAAAILEDAKGCGSPLNGS